MDLPTYTSIWRIEKRLYKLYDFRLPMPLPIGQLTVFMAISVPYVVLLTVLGFPFSHTLIWLYILPPGVLTWLATRPVLESKRLPELVGSQVRYLFEPKVLCRLAPATEPDLVRFSARIRRRRKGARSQRSPAAELVLRRPARTGPRLTARTGPGTAGTGGRVTRVPVVTPRAAGANLARGRPAKVARREVPPLAAQAAMAPRAATALGQGKAARAATAPPRVGVPAPVPWPEPAGRPGVPVREPAGRPGVSVPEPEPGPAGPGVPVPEAAGRSGVRGPAARAVPGDPARQRPLVTVVREGAAVPVPVERAIAGPGASRPGGSGQRVVVVPGGHHPGRPDRAQQDRARARLAISGSRTVVMLGCTVGAGQTTTALLLGEVLASIRDDAVAVADLNPNAGSAARRALARPALSQAASLGQSRLRVVGPGLADGAGDVDPAGRTGADLRLLDAAAADNLIVLADPATAVVPKLIAIADALVLVAPATAAAAGAITMTFEWLEAHGQAALAASSILVLNGVSRRTTPHVEAAERVVAGRCRAIVRVPWDDQLNNPQLKRTAPAPAGAVGGSRWAGVLSPAAVAAYTALAGVLVASLADPEPDPGPGLAGPGRAVTVGG